MPSPIVAATLQASALSTASNLCAQFIQAYQEQKPFALDLLQLIRFIALTMMTAPPNFHWQQFLEKSFPAYPLPAQGEKPAGLEGQVDVEMKARIGGDEPGRLEDGTAVSPEPKFSMKNTMTKWFIDCITMGAIMNTVAFFILMGAMKGQGLGQIWYNVKTVSLRPTHPSYGLYALLIDIQETIPVIIAGYKIWPLASIISFSFIPVHRRIVFLSFIGLLWGIYMSLVAARV